MKNHEKEIEMRLKFESKLNMMSAVYRELENRFIIITQEFQVNIERMFVIYDELKELKLYSKKISAENVEIKSTNKNLIEKNFLLQKLNNQYSESLLSIKSERENLKSEVLTIKEENMHCLNKIRELETLLKIKYDEHGNLLTEKDLKDVKIQQLEQEIERQNKTVNSILIQLKTERIEHEVSKNRLAVCQIQSVDLDNVNKTLTKDKLYLENKYKNIEQLHAKLTVETESIKFNFKQLYND